ncbi:hypothetical protein J6590_090611 [Homalodisca vitripennis]|nr:hypothetical protein J6590_090611 [Homalodisca vitripennis]
MIFFLTTPSPPAKVWRPLFKVNACSHCLFNYTVHIEATLCAIAVLYHISLARAVRSLSLSVRDSKVNCGTCGGRLVQTIYIFTLKFRLSAVCAVPKVAVKMNRLNVLDCAKVFST